MPFSDLPLPLQLRFKSVNARAVDLSNYPLNELSHYQYQELLKVLKDNPKLCVLNLANCGLLDFKYDISALFTGFQHLHTINLNHNQLSKHPSIMEGIYKLLGTLPNLQFFSIDDSVKEGSGLYYNLSYYIPYFAPDKSEPVAEFFSGLYSIPALRIYRIEKSPFISFLNSLELYPIRFRSLVLEIENYH